MKSARTKLPVLLVVLSLSLLAACVSSAAYSAEPDKDSQSLVFTEALPDAAETAPDISDAGTRLPFAAEYEVFVPILAERAVYVAGALNLYHLDTELTGATIEEDPAAPEIPIQPPGIDPDRPMIALTFDDGPSRYTGDILDLLYKHGGRATFAVLGSRIDAHSGTLVRTVEIGSEVIGHAWSHRALSALSRAQIMEELTETSELIAYVTGTSGNMFRPPYGAINSTVSSVAEELGYSIILWCVDTQDWRYRNADKVYGAVMRGAVDGAIILLHDIHRTTARAMERAIPGLIEKGYQLVTLSELMYHRHGELTPGKVYRTGR